MKSTPFISRLVRLVLCLACCSAAWCLRAAPAHRVTEVSFNSTRSYDNPFLDLTLDAVVTAPDGTVQRVPAFWAGGRVWRFRYAGRAPGVYTWRTECSDTANAKLHGRTGRFTVTPASGDNPFYRHGPLRVADDRRHLAYADGTPFFWLGDTWWKGLASRLPFEGFKRLAADRRAKGFTAIQIVAGPLPDEPPFDPRWANEGGMPYEKDYERINPAYFDQADRRIQHLIEVGLAPAIVGGWGWHMPSIGVEKMKRHWRYLVARYGAYPVVWIVGGEAGGAEWTAVAQALRVMDPFHRLTTAHPYSSGRQSLKDDTVLDFDMLQTGHGGAWHAYLGDFAGVASNTVSKVTSHYSKQPIMPVLVGEVTYEGHMMSNGADIQRFMFWSSLLNGAAGHTYGAGGIWQMNSETERGAEYEFTPWFEAMHLPGSTQLGVGKRLLENYPWWRFTPHPEWVEPHSTALFETHTNWFDDNKEFERRNGRWDLPYAAGILGEVRMIYIPGHYYQWASPVVKNLEREVPYHVTLVNPANGHRYGLGNVVSLGPAVPPFQEHAGSRLVSDTFEAASVSDWRDMGTSSRREGGRLVGGKGLVTVRSNPSEADLMASVDARSDAEAGLILRFHDTNHYLVALYTPSLKAIYLHDRRQGEWGAQLGRVEVPEIGPQIHLVAAVQGERAAMMLTDGQRTYVTPVVSVKNTASGPAGVWLYQIGERQEFRNFTLSRTPLAPARTYQHWPAQLAACRPNETPLVMHENPNIVPAVTIPATTVLPGEDYPMPRLPAPQDWVLILERLGR